jgi:hypothetical protein
MNNKYEKLSRLLVLKKLLKGSGLGSSGRAIA